MGNHLKDRVERGCLYIKVVFLIPKSLWVCVMWALTLCGRLTAVRPGIGYWLTLCWVTGVTT